MRSYCRCTVVQNYDYDQAAAKLRCERRFLMDRISTLPHQKLGQSVAFCDCELALIQQMFTKVPAEVLDLINPPAQQSASTPPAPPYAALRPSRGRKRQPAGV